jgi:hypothetical protein
MWQLQPDKVIHCLEPAQKNKMPIEHEKTNKNLPAKYNCVQPSTTRFKPP